MPSFTIKYSNTYSEIHIHYYQVAIDSFCITSTCAFDIYLIELFISELVLLSLPSYMNI